jgi:hypothetical protein
VKRILALFIAVSVGVTLAPVGAASASSGDRGDVSASAPASPERAAATTTPQSAPFASAVDRKKTCIYMCIQSKLPAVDEAVYFVNNNSGLLTFNDEGLSLMNLDTRRVVDTADYPAGTSASWLQTAISFDGDEVYFSVLTDSDGDFRVYRVNTTTLDLTSVTPPSSTYGLDGPSTVGLAVAPDNTGYYLISRESASRYLCKFDASGNEVGCSDGFGGAAIRDSSRVFTDYNGDLLFVAGNIDKLYTFLADGLSISSVETISEWTGKNIEFEAGTQIADGSMYFADRWNGGAVPDGTNIYRVSMNANVDYLTIPNGVAVEDMVAPMGESSLAYVLGVPLTTTGSLRDYNTLYELQAEYGTGELSLRKTMKIKADRNSFTPSYLTVDSRARYVLAYGEIASTLVVPVGESGSIDSYTDGTFNRCDVPVTYSVVWDYINLAPKKATKYLIQVKPMSGGSYRTVATVPANGDHSYTYTYTGVDVYLRVVPRKVNYNSHNSLNVYGTPPGISLRDRQPRC